MPTKTKTTPATVTAPAAQAKVKKPKLPPSSMVANIRNACEALSKVDAIAKLLEYRTFNSAGSFVVRLPSFKDAVDVLPQSPEAKAALALLKNTRGAVESLTGTAKQTWVFHTSGSFGLYSKLSA